MTRQAAVPLFLYQQRWLADQARFKIAMESRQIGKTFTTTLEIVDSCMLAAVEGRRERWVILSRGERQAKEAINEGVKLHAQAYNMAIKAIETTWRGDDGTYYALEVTLPGGSRITALPSNPDTARGFSANVFLDEFAFHLDSRAIWKALFPVISAGHKLRIASTPNGKSNKFHDIITAGKVTYASESWLQSPAGRGADQLQGDIWSRHIVDIHGAVADGLPREIDEMHAALDDEDAWQQEYELQWLDEASAWLPYDLISSVEDLDAGKPERYQGGPTVIGNDIGRKKDLWVAWVLELVGDVWWTREITILKGQTFAVQDATLDALVLHYNPVRIGMDQTGMGEKPVEDAQGRYGKHRVEGVMFSGPSKLAMATTGKEAFEDRRLRIPMGDRKLRTDLHSLRKVQSATGAPRFVAEADGPADSHADRAWALLLALNAASNPTAPMDWTAAIPANPWNGKRPQDDDDNDDMPGLNLAGGAW